MRGNTEVSTRELKQVGLKITLPRMKILDILHAHAGRHLSAEDIYKTLLNSGEEIGLATVYRVLTQFEAAGLVKRRNFEGGQSLFELDAGDHHDHIKCLQCGKIEEFFDEALEERQRAMAARLGFDIADHSLILYGNCTKPNCRNRL